MGKKEEEDVKNLGLEMVAGKGLWMVVRKGMDHRVPMWYGWW